MPALNVYVLNVISWFSGEVGDLGIQIKEWTGLVGEVGCLGIACVAF